MKYTALSLLAPAALLSGALLVACSSDDSSSGPQPTPVTELGPQTGASFAPRTDELARFSAIFNTNPAKAEITLLKGLEGATRTQGFGTMPSGTIEFETVQCQIGDNPAPNQICKAMSPLIAGCKANQYCVLANIKNKTPVTLRDLTVEFSYPNIMPIDMNMPAAVKMNPTDTQGAISNPPADSPLHPPLDAMVDAVSYGSLAPGQKSASLKWAYDLTNTENFGFSVRVLGTTPRTAVNYAAANGATGIDACANGTTILDTAATATAAAAPSDFLSSLYQSHSEGKQKDSFVAVSNGLIWAESTAPAGDNGTLPAGFGDLGIAPFWDAISTNWDEQDPNTMDGTSKVCFETTGSSPNRQYVVTWKDVALLASAGGMPSGDRLTFSAVVHEGSDVVDYVYQDPMCNNAPCMGTVSDRLRGSSATIGLYGRNGNVVENRTYCLNDTCLPAAVSDYPVKLTFTPSSN